MSSPIKSLAVLTEAHLTEFIIEGYMKAHYGDTYHYSVFSDVICSALLPLDSLTSPNNSNEQQRNSLAQFIASSLIEYYHNTGWRVNQSQILTEKILQERTKYKLPIKESLYQTYEIDYKASDLKINSLCLSDIRRVAKLAMFEVPYLVELIPALSEWVYALRKVRYNKDISNLETSTAHLVTLVKLNDVLPRFNIPNYRIIAPSKQRHTPHKQIIELIDECSAYQNIVYSTLLQLIHLVERY